MTITAKIRKQVNDSLHAISLGYKNQIPLGDIFAALRKAGLVAIQEDGRAWTGMLCGREGKALIEVAPVMSAKVTPERDLTFKPADNVSLSLSWYKMESGRYETNAYLA